MTREAFIIQDVPITIIARAHNLFIILRYMQTVRQCMDNHCLMLFGNVRKLKPTLTHNSNMTHDHLRKVYS